MTMWVILEDLGNFSPKKEKNLGEQKFARLSVSNFRGRVLSVFCESAPGPSVIKLFLSVIYKFL